MNKLDDAFLTYACDILAETDHGLSGMKIVEYCNSYAITYNRKTPYGRYPFDAPNKRSALRDNLRAFEATEQFTIIKELCSLPLFQHNEQAQNLRATLYKRYGNYAKDRISETGLVQATKHWLAGHPGALKQYESALSKFEGEIFERNTLDDMRLSFELLVKDILHNGRSLENQIDDICSFLKNAGASTELRNMVRPVINYYMDFQNHHVKHDDKVNGSELEFVIELTSVIMKYLIKVSGGKNNG